MLLQIHSKTGVKSIPLLLFAWLIFSQPQLFFVYTCSMRDALKNVFGKEIFLEDGTVFIYTLQPYEIKNMLGAIVAVLDEYSFIEKGGLEVYKLYRTNDGNWYQINQSGIIPQNAKTSALKLAVIRQEEQQNLT